MYRRVVNTICFSFTNSLINNQWYKNCTCIQSKNAYLCEYLKLNLSDLKYVPDA